MFPANLVQATFQQVRLFSAQLFLKQLRSSSFVKVRTVVEYSISKFIYCCTALQLHTAVIQCLWTSFLQYRTKSIPIMKSPKPTVSQDLTEPTTRRVFIYGIQDDNGSDIQNFSLDLTPPPDVIFRTLPGTSEGMNVLGIVIFSATMGKPGCWGKDTQSLLMEISLLFPHKITSYVFGTRGVLQLKCVHCCTCFKS